MDGLHHIYSDSQELQALRDGDAPRWRAWRAFLFRMARGRCQLRAEDADELVQDTCAKVLATLDTLREPAALLAFVLQILFNESRTRRRKRPRVPDCEPIPLEVPDHAPTPEEALGREEVSRLVRRALERVCAGRSSRERDLRIATGVLLDERKSKDLARELGVNPQTVYNVTHRIKGALEVALAGEAR